jgi:hypothetical protein
MRKFLALLAVVLLVASTGIALARVNPELPSLRSVTQAPETGWLDNDMPARVQGAAKTDTICFGYYEVRPDGKKYAVLGGEWTFDHGATDPFEGWTSIDQTSNDRVYWRQLTQAKWLAEGGVIGWPAMTGAGMVLCGATQGHADSLAWVNGRGYGNDWCQRLTSPTLTYDGSGEIVLSLKYFSESEPNYDYTKIFVVAPNSPVAAINAPGFNGKIGITTAGVLTPVGGVAYSHTITSLELGGGSAQRAFTVQILFDSDGGLSDEDGGTGGDSFYGGVGVDGIGLTGDNLIPVGNLAYNFDVDLQGWTASKCPGIGSYLGLGNMAGYIIADPCACSLTGNVLEMHNELLKHPNTQNEMLLSPIVDRIGDMGNPTYLSYNRIMGEWDQYADMPQTNGVFYRAGWSYYPFSNPHVPGMIMWSPRVGIATWYYAGDTPSCYFNRSIGTDWGLPSDAQQVKFVYELSADCAAFGVNPCSGITNFTPIIDNISVCNVGYVAAPVALFDTGTRIQDGFSQTSALLSTTAPGNSDAVVDLRRPAGPTLLGDSLMVIGPVPGPTNKWEARLWFRLKRMGPGQTNPGNPGLGDFNLWKARVTANRGDFYTGPNPNFAWGYMDSVEISTGATKNQFCSQFREAAPPVPQPVEGWPVYGEPCANWSGVIDEQGPGNEIFPDGVFTPGTKIEYFITTNYMCTPGAYYYYPDTTGKFYQEFEILPSFRTDPGNPGNPPKFPCVLYVDAFNAGAQVYIENALNVVLNGALMNDPIPDPTCWDRYDYMDASSNWNGPMYQMIGGNSGATIPQLLGYKLIMVSLGTASQGSMEKRDWQGFQQWLSTGLTCNWQGFIVDGTSAGEILNGDGPILLNNVMGATYTCRAYNTDGCGPPDQNDCVRLEQVGPFAAGIPTNLFGNWCPAKVPFNVLGTTGSGSCNKVFEQINSNPLAQTSCAQVINDHSLDTCPYRTVIDAFSYHLMVKRNLANPGLNECTWYPPDQAQEDARVEAAYTEIRNAIKWTMNIADPTTLCLCLDPLSDPNNVPDEEGAGVAVTRLYQNHPNPFNPRTAIKFSLAADGPTKLIIYDVNGRRIRTLVDSGLKAGAHEVVWDGSDDAGHTVTSGVYWSQLQVGAYSSNKKMVVLK